MGLGIGLSSSSYDNKSESIINVTVVAPPVAPVAKRHPLNPNPKNCVIKGTVSFNDFVLMVVVYPNCTNYEGRKLLVFKGCTTKQLKDQYESSAGIDPHFSDNKEFISPIARFEPSDEGYIMALKFMKIKT